MSIAHQRVLISNEESCIHCGAASREIHPGGVVPGRWKCTRCGHKQDELLTTDATVALPGVPDYRFTNHIEEL